MSKTAVDCPKCGHGIAGKKTEHSTGVGAIAIVVSIVIGIMMTWHEKGEPLEIPELSCA